MLDRINQEIKGLRADCHEFVRENRWVPWVAVLSVLLSYGLCLSGFRIGIDSEALITDSTEQLNSWYTIGRFSLVFTKNLLGMRQFNPMTENLLMMIFMVLYGIFASFLFWRFSGKSRRLKAFYIVFPALFLTHPCFAQQYLFTLQAFEVALGLLCCLVAVYCVSRFAFEGERWLLVPGIFLMVWGFGSYQALIPLYMAAALSIYLIYYEFHKKEKFYWKAALCHASAFVVSFILYELVVKAVVIWQKGFGFVGDYLEEQVLWTSNPIWVCIGHIKHYIREILLGESLFYPKTFLVFALIFAAHLLYRWLKDRRRDYILYALAALLLVLSPFYLALYQGSGVLMRTQMALPFTTAFFGAAAVSLLGNAIVSQGVKSGEPGESGGSSEPSKSGKFVKSGTPAGCTVRFLAGVVTAVGLLCSVYQGDVTSKAVLSAYMTYENDKITASQLVTRLQEQGAVFPGQKVAIIGQHRPYMPEGAGIREEVVGYSFFEWDYKSPIGVSKRGAGLLTALGYPCEPVSRDQYVLAKACSASMPSWPAEGSVQMIGGIAVIKFSEAE